MAEVFPRDAQWSSTVNDHIRFLKSYSRKHIRSTLSSSLGLQFRTTKKRKHRMIRRGIQSLHASSNWAPHETATSLSLAIHVLRVQKQFHAAPIHRLAWALTLKSKDNRSQSAETEAFIKFSKVNSPLFDYQSWYRYRRLTCRWASRKISKMKRTKRRNAGGDGNDFHYHIVSILASQSFNICTVFWRSIFFSDHEQENEFFNGLKTDDKVIWIDETISWTQRNKTRLVLRLRSSRIPWEHRKTSVIQKTS